jgi:Ethanolamine utilization protein EutJ (predicted chaperonin)
VAGVEQQERATIDGVVTRLQAAVAEVPREHFERLRGELGRRLAALDETPPPGAHV